MTRTAGGLAATIILFAVLATTNSGGYRYGVSDQAFYATAVVKTLHPTLYPYDTPLIETQSNLMLADEIVAGLSRVLGVDLPPLYFAIYVLTLIVLGAGAVTYARALGFSWWAVAALLLLLTFRHRIAKTGANSLEGYMHPRELAFAFGIFALAALTRGRHLAAAAWTAVAAALHPTTAIWFAIVAIVAATVARPEYRRRVGVAGALAALIGVWALTLGPLAGRLVVMPPAWLAVLTEKDYLFPTGWPAYAWATNLAYPIVIGLIYRRRRTLGLAGPGERALVAGIMALLAVFAVSVPLTALKLALAVQMQVTRVFWLMDFVTAAYLAWWLTSGTTPAGRRMRVAAIAVLAACSIGRGVYLLEVAQPDRRFVEIGLPATPWVDAMTWIKSQPPKWHVLADPGHAWKYGVSVRLAAERDTVLESGKDTALAMYDRFIAMRVADRAAALAEFDRLTTADFRALDVRYHLDVLVVDVTRVLDLPELYRNSQFVIYDLR